ncbi:uncharacterized protein [Onthophagus taurus]|uniref:uncharacterized protein n=1 Tax=Onthophagus taurus TaxID=166361 RepID=UPI000C209002|nr:uncharacterized protein LOC111425126 [Onthophagus taurus]
MVQTEPEVFSAHKFIYDTLEKEATKHLYDGSEEYFNSKPFLPEYYDEKKIKRAQHFFEQNISSMLLVSLTGLILMLSYPRGIKLLLATNKSSEPLTAYKRYRDTMKHMVSWYRGDFTVGSSLYNSLLKVRRMHNAAVRLGLKKGDDFNIDQALMGSTAYGFFGLALAKQKEFGLSSASDEDLEALVHFWRVIGYMLGVDDRFTICRESLKETRDICIEITNQVTEYLYLKDPGSLMLQFAILDGNNLVIPAFDSNLFMNFIYDLCNVKPELYYPMTTHQKFLLTMIKRSFESMNYSLIRRFFNSRTRYIIYLIHMHPEIIEHNINDTDLLTLI